MTEISTNQNEESLDERLSRLSKKALRLPLSPGVYIMKDNRNHIIYIGKAKALKNRVSQYFRSIDSHTEKVRQMVLRAQDFEYIICDSEFEALILECSLIKHHSPKYNILLKDDKGYHYLKITKGDWPTLKAVKMIEDDDSEYLGPYNSGWIVNQTLAEALKAFKLPDCNKVFPRDIKKARPCLNYFIGTCSAPCAGKVKKHEYNESVNEAINFIKGGSNSSVSEMKKKMELAADNLEFERAARLRDRINAIDKMKQKQKVVTSVHKRQDVIALAMGDNAACFEVFIFKNAKLTDREQFIVERVDNPKEARTEFIKRYYSIRDDIPPRIALDGEYEDKQLLEQWLSQKAKRKVYITCPQRGEQLDLIKMCYKNAAEFLAEKSGKSGRDTAALDELSRLLGLNFPPKYIEAYDISNTSGSENVAGMVVFCDGKPLKSAYRKFKIKSFEGQDDYRSLSEVLSRRFDEYYKLKHTGEGFGRLPDLILLDGGIGQLNAAKSVLKDKNINVSIFGMVKDSKHKTRAITSEGGDISIKANRRAYTLISTIQEEVHRFAIGYHRQRRAKAGLKSELTEINSVGEKTANTLLKNLKTMKAIKNATAEELAAIKGVTKTQAKNIFVHYRKK